MDKLFTTPHITAEDAYPPPGKQYVVDLIDVSFPECMAKCAFVERMGVSECDLMCPWKSTAMKVSFCESVTAGSATPWHIRQLTDKGPKFSGGADTKALCGREVAWDLNVEITMHHLAHCCKTCAEKYKLLGINS